MNEEMIKRYNEIRRLLLGEILVWNEEFYMPPCQKILGERARETLYEGIDDPLVKLVLKCQWIGEKLRKADD